MRLVSVSRRMRWLPALFTTAVLLMAQLPVTTPVQADSPDVVISQVYGGGGNTGAPYTSDFIELFNRGTASASVTGWSVQYASATGSTWSKVNLSGTLQPGQHYLVQLYTGTTGAALPTPDATGTTNMSATAGKVALVTNQTLLTCGASTNNCFPNANIRDFVGYGTANNYEGAGPAPAPSNTAADLRAAGGCTDTDSNSANFTAGSPAPHNMASALTPCGGGSSFGIHTVQGASHISPYNGKTVSNLAGIVTAKSTTGFWMQDPAPDSDPATSEGIYVYTSTAPTVVAGDSVTVSGTVSEYRSSSSAANLTVTEITGPTVTINSHGNPLPAATVVGTGGRIPPSAVIENDATGDVETSGTFDPATDGLDFWESLEGMRVQINNAVAVSGRNTSGEVALVGDSGANATGRNSRGGLTISSSDFNPERVIIDDILAATPSANVGDSLGTVTGVLDYSRGNYKLLVTTAPTLTAGGLTKESTTAAASGQLMVATFNVENLAYTDPQSEFDTLASLVVNNLKSPDVLAVEEVQDNSGATDDGVVDSSQTLAKLITAIQTAGGPSYSYRQIDPVNDSDGGAPGGNIRQVFLFRTDRGLAFVDRAGGTSTNSTSVISGTNGPRLTYSPGRIDPTNSAWNSSRKPLAGEFTWGGHTLFVIANHFNSKGGDDPLFGHLQPPTNSSETQRHSQAQIVNNFVASILSLDASARVIVMGDLNDYQFSQTLSILKGAQLRAPLESLPAAEQYTYVYDGNSQAIDHILVSSQLYSSTWTYDVVHVNAEFTTRASDHDPSVMRIVVN